MHGPALEAVQPPLRSRIARLRGGQRLPRSAEPWLAILWEGARHGLRRVRSVAKELGCTLILAHVQSSLILQMQNFGLPLAELHDQVEV